MVVDVGGGFAMVVRYGSCLILGYDVDSFTSTYRLYNLFVSDLMVDYYKAWNNAKM
jgi:hypothetical protein